LSLSFFAQKNKPTFVDSGAECELEHWCGDQRKKALANNAKAGEQNILYAGLLIPPTTSGYSVLSSRPSFTLFATWSKRLSAEPALEPANILFLALTTY
jgi:hypothetical protein